MFYLGKVYYLIHKISLRIKRQKTFYTLEIALAIGFLQPMFYLKRYAMAAATRLMKTKVIHLFLLGLIVYQYHFPFWKHELWQNSLFYKTIQFAKEKFNVAK